MFSIWYSFELRTFNENKSSEMLGNRWYVDVERKEREYRQFDKNLRVLCVQDVPPGGGEDVVHVDDSSFDSILMGSHEMWLVEFYAPWFAPTSTLFLLIALFR